jgi:PAT family beta-lactamase induction signal transducer AmpG
MRPENGCREDDTMVEAVRDRSWTETFLAFFERRLIAVLFLGFSSGLPLALTASTLQARQTESGVDLTTIGFFVLVAVAYSLKFVWAPLIDRSYPPGPFKRLGHRRGWTLLFQLLLMIAIAVLGLLDPARALTVTALAAVVVAFLSASQDIVIDAYRIELLDEDQQGAGAAMIQYGYRLGMLVSGAGALYIAEYVSWPVAYLTMAGLIAVGIVTVLVTREPHRSGLSRGAPDNSDEASFALRVGLMLALAALAILAFFFIRDYLLPSFDWPRWAGNAIATLTAAVVPIVIVASLPRPGGGANDSYRALHAWLDKSVKLPFIEMGQREGWVLILLFIVLYKLGDAVLGTMATPFYLKIGFTKPEIANISKTFGLIATLVGVYLGGLMVLKLGMARALLITGVLQMLSNLMFAWQAHVGADTRWLYVTIAVENLSGGMGSAAFVAYLSALCNIAFTATQYALFSSLAALGRTVIAAPMGGVAETMGWVDYFLLSTVMGAPGLVLLLFMIWRYPVSLRAASAAPG